MAHSLIPIISLAGQLANNKNLEIQKTKPMLSDFIRLLWYGFYNLSIERKNKLKNCYNSRTFAVHIFLIQLFGDNCITKQKDLGDMNKHSLSSLRIRIRIILTKAGHIL